MEKNEKIGFPKWDGLIDLKEAGLPVPNAIFIKPYSEKLEIENIVEFFIVVSKTTLISLRPDGKCGIGKTPPGMNFEKTEKAKIINKLIEWSGEGYGVTFVETHNRFDFDFCCNVLFCENGDFTIEFVGPGFDGGDLNKSILKPTMTVKNRSESPVFMYSDPISGEPNIETLERFYFRVDISGRVPTKEEIDKRLKYIMTQLLPDMGIKIEKTLKVTKEWLKENECERLLEQKNLRSLISIDDLQKLIFSASLYAHSLLSKGKSLNARAITAHKYDGKIVFFGTYDSQKWGNFSKSTPSVSSQVSPEDCPLCNSGIILCQNHLKLYGDEIKETNFLFESKNFYVVVDNYPVCDDHILIVPKKHVVSYSVINKNFEYELDAIIKTLSDIIGTERYGLFEHGSNFVDTKQKACGNSVFHAHMHFIPNLDLLRQDVSNLVQMISLKNNYSLNDCCTHKELNQTALDYLQKLPTKNPYLFCYYSNTTGESFCVPDDIIQNGVPSQFFRKVFAEHFQKNMLHVFWNWKVQEDLQKSIIFRTAIMKKTVEKFKDEENIIEVFEKHLHDKD